MLHCHCVWCRGVELAAHGVAGMSGCYITTAPTAAAAGACYLLSFGSVTLFSHTQSVCSQASMHPSLLPLVCEELILEENLISSSIVSDPPPRSQKRFPPLLGVSFHRASIPPPSLTWKRLPGSQSGTTDSVATMGSLGPSFPDHDHDLSPESCQNIRFLQNTLPLLVFQRHLALVCLHPLLALEQWLDLIVYMSYIALCSCTQVFHMVLFLL